jgi:hypothetical protein
MFYSSQLSATSSQRPNCTPAAPVPKRNDCSARTAHNPSVFAHAVRFALPLLLLLALAGSACGSSDEGTATLGGMTFDEVHWRVVDALFPADAIMHTREIDSDPPAPGRPLPPPRDVWRSVATGEARVGGRAAASLIIYRDGTRFSIRDGLLIEEPTTPSLPYGELLGSAHNLTFYSPPVRMKYVTLDGIEAIRLRFGNVCDDGPCSDTDLYVSRDSFLPVKARTGNSETLFEHERLERSALPDDFFSLNALTAIADAVPSPPESWRAMGHTAYWLGPEFEGLVPSAGTPLAPAGASAYFSIGYAPPATEEFPVESCIAVNHRSDLVPPPFPGPVENVGAVRAPIGDITIYRHEDQWAAWHGLADGSTLVAVVSCDPSGGVLRSLEGMTRLANALRIYDGPARMVDFAAISATTP